MLSLRIWAAHPLLLAPSTALHTAALLDFGLPAVSKSRTNRFSVDLLFAASRSKAQRTKPSYSTRNLHYGSRRDGTKLTVWGAHDGLFDHIAAGNSLLKALGALLQEPFSCCHLQLPANTLLLSGSSSPPAARQWLITRRLTSACHQSSQSYDRKCLVTGFTVILGKAEGMKPEKPTALFTKTKTALVFITE